MKKLILFLIALFGISCTYAQENNKHGCGTDELHFKQLKEDANYRTSFEKMNTEWQRYAPTHVKDLSSNRSVPLTVPVTLPIVFHNMTTPATAGIPLDYDAIVVSLTSFFTGSDISFCRALKKKNGDSYINASINHPAPSAYPILSNTSTIQIDAYVTSSQAQNQSYFPSLNYINVYIVDDIVNPVAGFASLPSAVGTNRDGIFIERQWLVGVTNDNMKVLVHEMGHYLGLLHLFGICDPATIHNLDVPDGASGIGVTNACSCDNSNCLFNGDMICDTPPSQLVNSCNLALNTCHTDVPLTGDGTQPTGDLTDLKNNYMDYSPQSCQNDFTDGQVTKMQFTVDPDFGPRKKLHETHSCDNACTELLSCTFFIIQLPNIVTPASQTLINSAIVGSIVNFQAAKSCVGTNPNINYSWTITQLNSTNPVINGVGQNFQTSFTEVGNYSAVLTATLAGSADCFETVIYNFQIIPVTPPGSCLLNLPDNSWTGWNRVSYNNGWNRNSTPTYNLSSTLSTRHINGFGLDTNGFEIITSPTLPPSTIEPNYPNMPVPVSITGTNLPVMRVGRVVKPGVQNTHNSGDAYYSSFTFHPTAQNCKYRVYYIGVAEFATNSCSFNSNVTVASDDTSFGFVSEYNFTSPLSTSPNNAIFGYSETGDLFSNNLNSNLPTFLSVKRLLQGNDFVYGKTIATTGNTIIGGQYNKLNNWQYKDLDFSEFINTNVDITITFFSRSNSGATANKHSYAYFAVDCLGGGVTKNLVLNLPDIQLPCTPPNSTSSCSIFTINLNTIGNPHNIGTINTPLSNYNLINYTVTPVNPTSTAVISSSSTASNILNTDSFQICLTHSNVPFEDFVVTVTTMNQVVTDVFRVFYGFYYQFDACPGVPIGSVQEGGDYTLTTPRNLLFCPGDVINTTFSLQNPCMITGVDPSTVPQSDYEWIVPAGIVFTSTFDSITITSVPNSICSFLIYRNYKYKDPYCGIETIKISAIFYIHPLLRNLNLSATSQNACVNQIVNINLNGFYISNNCITNPGAMLTLASLNQTGSVQLQVINPSTGLGISNLVTIPITNNAASIGSPTLTFNNLDGGNNPIYFGNNSQIHIQWSITRYGCTLSGISTAGVLINFEGYATGGTIGIGSTSSCPDYDFISLSNGVAGSYIWQFSFSGAAGSWVDITGSNSTTLNNFTITNNPTYIRRVAHSDAQTASCSFDAYSNVIQFPLVPNFTFSQVYCQGETINPNPLPQSYQGISGNWSPSTINTALVGTFNYVFTPSNLLCLSIASIPITIIPSSDPSCTCQPDLTTWSTINTVVEEKRSVWIRSSNIINPYTGNRTIYHADNFIELLPENAIANHGFNAEFGSKFAAYIDVCANGFDYKDSNIIIPIKQLTIFPNPTNGLIEILMKDSKFNKISISSIDGKTIYDKTIQSDYSYQIDLSKYPTGIYIVNVIADDGQVFNEKVIKN